VTVTRYGGGFSADLNRILLQMAVDSLFSIRIICANTRSNKAGKTFDNRPLKHFLAPCTRPDHWRRTLSSQIAKSPGVFMAPMRIPMMSWPSVPNLSKGMVYSFHPGPISKGWIRGVKPVL